MGKIKAQNSEDEIINAFAKEIGCLNPIYKELSDINLFEILKIDQMEIRHSNFLAWLLDPSSLSGIGDKLLKRLLMYCSDNNDKNPAAKNCLNDVSIELMDLEDVTINREQTTGKSGKKDKHIDMLISSTSNKFCICIENKINSGESENQLSDYYKYIETKYARKDTTYVKYKYDNRYYIFLTPTGIEAKKDDDKSNWIALSYSDVYDWIEELLQTYEENIPSKSKGLIRDYLNALNRHVIEGAFKNLCDEIYMQHIGAFAIFEKYKKNRDSLSNINETNSFKIYKKHRAAINLVLDNRTEISQRVKLQLVEALGERGQFVKYDPKRAPIYLKAKGTTRNERLVDPDNDDISKDFLYYELYYAPGEKVFFLNLKCKMERIPHGFHNENYTGGVLNNNVLIKSKKLGVKEIADYISNLEKESRKPSKDDEPIQNLCKQIVDTMSNAKFIEGVKKIESAIS